MEIVPVFSGIGQGMVTMSMAAWMEGPCHSGGVFTTETQRAQRLCDLCASVVGRF
jgi:hypothetical protein